MMSPRPTADKIFIGLLEPGVVLCPNGVLSAAIGCHAISHIPQSPPAAEIITFKAQRNLPPTKSRIHVSRGLGHRVRAVCANGAIRVIGRVDRYEYLPGLRTVEKSPFHVGEKPVNKRERLTFGNHEPARLKPRVHRLAVRVVGRFVLVDDALWRRAYRLPKNRLVGPRATRQRAVVPDKAFADVDLDIFVRLSGAT